MDTSWPFNFDNPAVARYLPSFFDNLIIPKYFYTAVIERNTNKLNNLIKYNPKLSINIVAFYNLTLKDAFYYKKDAKFGAPVRIKWATETQNHKIIINFNEQSQLYKYTTTAPPKSTNMGFLVNTINNYLVQLRYVMGLINRKIPANQYYDMGVNVKNNYQMKIFISQFIPGVNINIQNIQFNTNPFVNNLLNASLPGENQNSTNDGTSGSFDS